MSKKEIEFVVSYDVKTGKTTRYDNRFDAVRELVKDSSLRVTEIAWKTGYNKGHVSRLRKAAKQKPPLTDEEIDALLPEADGTTEEVKRKVEYRPGLWADAVGIDDAWSKSLVIEIIRAVEKHHGIGAKR